MGAVLTVGIYSGSWAASLPPEKAIPSFEGPLTEERVKDLLTGAIANRDLIESCCVAMTSRRTEDPAFAAQDWVRRWFPVVARKAGNVQKAIALYKEQIVDEKDPKRKCDFYHDLVYCAILACDEETLKEACAGIEREMPDSWIAKWMKCFRRNTGLLGRITPSLDILTHDGKPFLWEKATKGKIVFLHFTASW